MSQPEAELEAQGGQPESEPSLLDIAGLMDKSEEGHEVQKDPEGEHEPEAVDGSAEPEPEEPEEPEAKPSEDDWKARKVKVTVQGEEHEITLEEATHGYMRDQDYRRKTAEVAQSTKALEQKQQYVETELAKQVNHLHALGFALQQELIGDQSQLKQLLETDPQEYLRVQAKMNEKSAYLAQVMQAQQNVESHRLRQSEDHKREAIESGNKILLERIPEWRDEGKRRAEQREIASALLEAQTAGCTGHPGQARSQRSAQASCTWLRGETRKVSRP
jgi:hypothetical protein